MAGRPRRHANQAARQKAYEERKELVYTHLEQFLKTLAHACEAGRCAHLTNHLPENPAAQLSELTRRLQGRRIIVCNPEVHFVKETTSE